MSEGLGISGAKSMLNIAAATLVTSATVSSYSQRRLARVSVLVAGSTAGSVNDALSIATAAAANQVFVIPNTVGVYAIDFPILSGIVVTPGTGQTVAVSYD
jgi:hypothetical protein